MLLFLTIVCYVFFVLDFCFISSSLILTLFLLSNLSAVALHCITLHYITLHCIALHYITLHCIAFHCIALHYITLHCIALHYITLHYITLHTNPHHATRHQHANTSTTAWPSPCKVRPSPNKWVGAADTPRQNTPAWIPPSRARLPPGSWCGIPTCPAVPVNEPVSLRLPGAAGSRGVAHNNKQ